MKLVADRLDRISPSLTIAMTAKARALKAAGRDVIGLSAGEPDFDTPRNIKDAAIAAIERGETKYTDVAGTLELRRAVCARFKADHGVDFAPEEILVATGGKQVIFDALLATIGPGDEAIIPAPCWVSYPDIVELAEGKPVIVPCGENQGFKMRPEQLEAAITPRTKWLILNNPSNPTGAAYDAAEMKALTDVLLRHPDVWVFTDDIYNKLTYGGFRPATVLEVEPRLRSRTVTMNGCSKAYAMTGWRIGYAAAPVAPHQGHGQAAKPEHQQHQQHQPGRGGRGAFRPAGQHRRDARRLPAPPRPRRGDAERRARHPLPQAGRRLLRLPLHAGLRRQDQRRRRAHRDDEDFCNALLDEAGVACVHGTAFMFPGHFRISYATSDAVLTEACGRIQRFCAGLR